MGQARKIVGALDVVLIVLTFFPWLNLDLYIWYGSYSLPGLIQLVGSFQSQASSWLGSYYTSSDISTDVLFMMGAFIVMWFLMIILLARDAFSYFSGKKKFRKEGPWATCALTALILVGCFVLDSNISSNLGVSGVITGTVWLWATLILSAVTLVYIGAVEPQKK